MKETEFVWVEPLKPEWRTGILKGGVRDANETQVPFVKVGCYLWPKCEDIRNRDIESGTEEFGTEEEEYSHGIKLVGIFLHGGGYCHMSAHENSKTSQIPRDLIKVRLKNSRQPLLIFFFFIA